MYFNKNKNIKLKKVYFYKNFINWKNRYYIWHFFFFGFFFDEIYSQLIKKIFKLYFLLPGFYFFDKYFSYWTSYNFFKNFFFFFNNYLYVNKINENFILFYLIFCFLIQIFFFILINLIF